MFKANRVKNSSFKTTGNGLICIIRHRIIVDRLKRVWFPNIDSHKE